MITKYVLIIIFLSSCKTEIKNTVPPFIIKEESRVDSIAPLNIQEQNKYTKNVLKKIDYLELEPNGGGKYKKNKKTLFIDVLEEMKTHEKHIMYMLSHYDENNDRSNEGFSYFTNSYNKILLAIYEFNRYGYDDITGNKKNDEIIVKDTFLFKNNKIYFWKNKEATTEELLIKEKEILLVKREVDSLLKD